MRLKLIVTSILFFSAFSSFALAQDKPTAKAPEFSDLPVGLTSFGAVRVGNALYAYGGHTGQAHSYSNKSQSDELLKLDLDHPSEPWKAVAKGQAVQGNALVAFEDRVITVGGFSASNVEGEDHDLHSQSTVRAFDTKTNTWQELPSLPQGRSSHDAIVMGNSLYVVGGWMMDSPNETKWHSTALVLDLSKEDATWQELPASKFERRALALAAHNNKLFVIGGMNSDDKPTRAVSIYDPSTKNWSEGPELNGESSMAGFGAAAWSLNGKLVVCGYEGTVQVLSDTHDQWTTIGSTKDARFFHRILPLNDHQLVSIGGASMTSGKFLTPEVIDLEHAK